MKQEPPNRTSIPPFNVVILYSSLTDGTRAFQVFQRLLDLFGADYAFENRLFKLDWLPKPVLALEAARNVSRADMVIVSVGSEQQLTPDFKRWAQEWQPAARASNRILVALLDENLVTGTPCAEATPFLSGLAEQNGMDFLCNVGRRVPCRGRVAARLAGLAELNLPVRVHRSDRVVPHRREHTKPAAFARWGLNE